MLEAQAWPLFVALLPSTMYTVYCNAGAELEGAWHRTHKEAAQKLACYLEDLPARPPLQPVMKVAQRLSIAAGLAVEGMALSGAAAAGGWGVAGWQGMVGPRQQQQQQQWRGEGGGSPQLKIAGVWGTWLGCEGCAWVN